MWLPTAIYERAPHYWLLLGLLLIVVGAYLGFQSNMVYLYAGAGVGLASFAWGIRVLVRRKTRRPSADPDMDQTCELNYRPE